MTKNIYFVILVQLLSTVQSTYPTNDPPKTGPGISGCMVWGEIEHACNISDTPIQTFPKECTSFIYDGIRIDMNLTLTEQSESLVSIKGYLDKLLAKKKKVFLYFGHTDEFEWITAVNVSEDNIETVAKNEMEVVKTFLDQHKGISGLIIVKLERHELYEFTGNVKKYIEVMKDTVPGLEVGLNVDCVAPIFYTNHPDKHWFDFKTIVSSFDFYLVSLYDTGMNECTKQFEKTGVLPLTGDTRIMNTTDIITKYLTHVMGVPQSKIFYNYQTAGTLPDTDGDYCTTFYPYICENNIKDTLCADTQQSLYEKGRYACENGEGFVTGTIDLDDAYGICKCGTPFPAFYALLNGFNDESPPAECPLFDRT